MHDIDRTQLEAMWETADDCYRDRGHGTAIRRARTYLPGDGESPVAIIRVPRERMVGCGIASSLMYEVDHQGSALLDLAGSLRPILRGLQQDGGLQELTWLRLLTERLLVSTALTGILLFSTVDRADFEGAGSFEGSMF